MKKYMVVKTEILEKILRCFANQEEFETFAGEFGGMIEEVVFAGKWPTETSKTKNWLT